MGQLFSALRQIFANFGGHEPARILMLGLDAAGKTTILYKVKLNEQIQTIPTIGFNVETVEPCKGVTFTVWDVGGQTKIRALWRHYYQNAQGLIFVVDSSDRERVAEAREELFGILSYEEMRTVPIVVLANKQDMPNAMTACDLIDGLHLRKLTCNRWHVQTTSARTGDGLCEGFREMSALVKESHKDGRH